MRRMFPTTLALAAAIAATLITSDCAFADIVILRSDGTPATSDQVLKWQDSQGKWHIILQDLYAPSGTTLYEIRGSAGETIERIIIHVPCWTGPNGQCVPAGSPVFVRVLSDPPLGVQSVNQIIQSGTAETLLTHVVVNEDIGSVSVDAIGILEAGRDILGPVTANTPENPNRGIAEALAGRHILGDLTAMKGRIGKVHAGGNIGSPAQPVSITFKHNSLDVQAQDVHAHIDTRFAGGNGHLWRFEADRFFGSLQTPYLGHHYQSGAPGVIRVLDTLAGSIEIGGSFNDPAHLIELPIGGVQGQVVINADNLSGTWSAPIHLGPVGHPDHAAIYGPTYNRTSEEIGGGAIGLVPFRLHHASSSPPSGSTIVLEPDDPEPVVELDHYGPLHLASNEPVLIERRPIDGQLFTEVAIDQFAVQIPDGKSRTLRISGLSDSAGFETGYEYRITPTASLRSHAAGVPAVVWAQPFRVTFEDADTQQDDPDPDVPVNPTQPSDPDLPVCPGDLNNDGVVNVFDLLILLSSWGPCASCAADLDASGMVNVFDLLILLADWGPC